MPQKPLTLTGDIRLAHDPTIVVDAGIWWLVSTGPGIGLRKSTDGRKWQYVQEIFKPLPESALKVQPNTKNLWAPDLVKVGSRWHLYYSVSAFGKNRSAICLASNKVLDPTHPDYAWKDEGIVVESFPTDHYNAIDPSVAKDEKGIWWMTLGSFWGGCQRFRLNAAATRVDTSYQMSCVAQRPELPHAIEAPAFFFRRGWWYLVVSFDFCCRGSESTYNIRVGRSRTIDGEFLDAAGQKLSEGGGTMLLDGRGQMAGPGHAMITTAGRTDYLVHHWYDKSVPRGVTTLGIRPISWTRSGWPEVDRDAPVVDPAAVR